MSRFVLALATTLVVCAVGPASAQIHSQVVVTGLSHPVAFVQDPSRPDVQLIAEQGGRIRVLQAGALLDADYLDLTTQVSPSWIGGLLGLAFAPDYAASGRIYVNFTDQNNNTVIARFTRSADDPLRADPDSRFDLRWPGGDAFIFQPYGDHNGGDLAFGPDGFLWIALGDGGGAGDPEHRAQDPMSLLGKMLRLDVNVADDDAEGYDVPADNPFVGRDDILPEIWALGLRNPWRYSFDDPARGGTGALLLADVGQTAWEEINYEPAGSGGRNYGWRVREGANDYDTTLPPWSEALTDPIFQYSHDDGHSITGGFVYRGAALGGYEGRYFFGDFIYGRLWSMLPVFDAESGQWMATDVVEHTADVGRAADQLVSFGVDADGELYLVSWEHGEISKIVPGAPAPPPPALPNGQCATPDPFLSIGGGTCVNGNWLPPTGTPEPAPPAPPDPATPLPTPPPPGNASCTTPDPFVALGGGTCVNGDWLPPGSVPAPDPALTPTPTPTPAPPPASGGCDTPDPFASLGGGTCVNGGWLPPGFPVPSAPPLPSPGGCTTPDPFVSIPTLVGVCVNGNWIPMIR
jgi:glucose/arabinose dehydrogenase